jgi:hypothetical protein
MAATAHPDHTQRLADSALDTYHYLRIAMVVVIAGLVAGIAYERAHVHASCFQTSISAYYYTPVRALFVSTLVALGLAMICLKGNTDTEDILLNLAGMFAPVVAFVPTPNIGTCPPSTAGHAAGLGALQRSVVTGGADPDIANNIFSVLVIGAIGLALVGTLLTVRRQSVRWQAILGYAVAFAAFLAAVILFNADRHWFNHNAHYAAASLLFLCIIAVVIANAVNVRDHRLRSNPYIYIAATMVIAAIVIFCLKWTGWQHWLLVLEASIIGLFALFWVVQTIELWRPGLRHQAPEP